ncbi:MAG: hypothetical protein ABL903_11170 [Methylococcales bacterium]
MLSKISAPHQLQSTSRNRFFAYSLLILNGGLLLPTCSQAVTFTKLVDSSDQVPGATVGEKFKLGYAALNGNIVVFSDINNQTLWSINISKGLPSLIKLVDTHTPIPQGMGNFKSVSVQNSGDKVIFKGVGDAGQIGVYAVSATGGDITMLINQSTIPPSLMITSGFGGSPYFTIAINDGLTNAVLIPRGIFSWPSSEDTYSIDSTKNTLTPLFKTKENACDTRVSIWGDFDVSNSLAAFSFFISNPNEPSIPVEGSGGMVSRPPTPESVVVAGTFSEMNNFNPSCLKPFSEHGSMVIASGQDIVPGTEPNLKTFDSKNAFFGTPLVDGDTVVFAGTAKSSNNTESVTICSDSSCSNRAKPEHFGLYSSMLGSGRKIHKLADTKTAVPGGTGNFSAFGSYVGNNGDNRNAAYCSLSGNKTAFMGEDIVGKKGLYLSSTTDDSLVKIIAAGDNLGDGRIVGKTSINKDSLQGDHLLFTVNFSGKDTGVGLYLASLSANSNVDPKTCLMNWAEVTYPGLFAPASAATRSAAPYTYRYYQQSNAYLGISSADNHVHYLGADRVLKDAGDLAGWLAKANCQ